MEIMICAVCCGSPRNVTHRSCCVADFLLLSRCPIRFILAFLRDTLDICRLHHAVHGLAILARAVSTNGLEPRDLS